LVYGHISILSETTYPVRIQSVFHKIHMICKIYKPEFRIRKMPKALYKNKRYIYSHSVPDGTGIAATMSRQGQKMSVENRIGHKRPSRQGRNVFVFLLMYRLFVNKSLEPENKCRITVLMSKTSYVYRKKMLCFNLTPKGSNNGDAHCFYKHLTSSRSNCISPVCLFLSFCHGCFIKFSSYFLKLTTLGAPRLYINDVVMLPPSPFNHAQTEKIRRIFSN
jgi:hypothetical protein